jgi:murein DD-endopeptidase MepM/ murein hydrolase activator NlpD
VSPVNSYKKNEIKVVEVIVKILRVTINSIVTFIKLVIQKGKQRFTVMFIPHSEKKILNFHISVFSLVFICSLIVVLILAFFYLSAYFTGSEAKFLNLSRNLESSTQNLEEYKDQIKKGQRVLSSFRKNMEDILKMIKGDNYSNSQYNGAGGDLSSMAPFEGLGSSDSEIGEFKNLLAYINNSIEPLNEIYDVLLQQRELLVDIPNLWPVYGKGSRIGNITDVFGPGQDPITNGFRIHYGVDIAWSYGTPVVATANGIVNSIDYNPLGLGNNVTIKHKYGFSTRYGHFQKIIVYKGQHVSRGDILGYMGSTGRATGPHVHYEIWMGTQVVDPMQYLDIDNVLVEKFR